MIFTRDFVTGENYWPITSLVTQKSLFTVTHARLSETGHCGRSHSSWTPPKCSNLCAKYPTKAARKRTIRKCIASDGTDHICWMMLRVVLKWYLWMWLVMSPVPVQWTMTGHWVLSVMSCWYMWLSTLSLIDVNSVWIKVSIFCWRYKHGCYGYRYI